MEWVASARMEANGLSSDGGDQRILPFGETLHYPGCGCPPEGGRGPGAGALVDAIVQQAFTAFTKRQMVPKRRLRVAYMLPHHNITGTVAWL